ncbi:cytochrome c oxidase assembly protein COX11, mitochondrial [Sphaerodactylus townsendi]|uniref:Cytochrome c oxidase assembly protein cox11, mitochondrial n=1 Tax=Sphaerodactylus townsendi TaxID=933632 RepID=A0ACB8ENW7_9SAUR|nr:cytochrome c oxidase assembly protein COX11, mitochondrial [Sphaerodactylus townsendi]
MDVCGREWVRLAAKGVCGGWGPWRAWVCLRGQAALAGRHWTSSARFSGGGQDWSQRNRTVLTYLAAAAVGMAGVSYAAVPLYRLYCQATGLGGSAVAGHGSDQIETMERVKDRILKITFNADVHSSLQWNFRPQQTEVYVVPGETALAFYKAKNPTDKPIIGISTYNVVPFEAGQYFNKIQCFCFEEQRLNPHEEVDMPVFFFIDPEFAEDPKMAKVSLITLSYTFFEAKEGQKLPLPGYN